MIRSLVVSLAVLMLAACATNMDNDDAGRRGRDRQSKESGLPKFRYSGDVGTSPVGVIPNATLHDGARSKDLELSIEYPTKGTAHPLIVFSPDFGLSSRDYVGISSYWASCGYIVMKLTHADSLHESNPADQTATDWRERVRD